MSQAFLHNLHDRFSELCDVLGRGAEERPFDNEEGRTVNSGPGDVLRLNSLLPRQNACLDDPIQSRTEQLEGVEPALACSGGIHIILNRTRDGKGGSEKSRLPESEFQISGTDGPQFRTRFSFLPLMGAARRFGLLEIILRPVIMLECGRCTVILVVYCVPRTQWMRWGWCYPQTLLLTHQP